MTAPGPFVRRAAVAAFVAFPVACGSFTSSELPTASPDGGELEASIAPDASTASDVGSLTDAEAGAVACLLNPTVDDFERVSVPGHDWSVANNTARAKLTISKLHAVSGTRSLRVDLMLDPSPEPPPTLTRVLESKCVELSFSVYLEAALSTNQIQAFRISGAAVDGGIPPLLIGSIASSSLVIARDGDTVAQLVDIALVTDGWTKVSVRYSSSGEFVVERNGVALTTASPAPFPERLTQLSVGAIDFNDSAQGSFFLDDLTVR